MSDCQIDTSHKAPTIEKPSAPEQSHLSPCFSKIHLDQNILEGSAAEMSCGTQRPLVTV